MSLKESLFFEPESGEMTPELLRRKELMVNLSKKVLNMYETRHEIPGGRGKAGFIWRGETPFSATEKICIKSIHNKHASINTLREEFELLSQAYEASVSVPEPFAFFDYGDDLQMLVMRHIDGMDGKAMMRAGKKIPREEFKGLQALLKKEVIKLHQAGIYHRDLHIEGNVIFRDDGDISIIDFGDAIKPFMGAEENEIYIRERIEKGVVQLESLPRDEQVYMHELAKFISL